MDNKLDQLKDNVLILVKSITKNPTEVSLHVEEQHSEDKGEFVLISIKVSSEDIPVCIGQGGSTAEAIRRLTCLVARRLEYDKRLFVRIDAPVMPKNHFDFKG
jgi:predicted RNA-binding protein YlqC (UPF0109 family)